MQDLPSEQEQHWLLVSTAALIRLTGHEPFLINPIVEPTPEFFPDPWTYSSRGLDRVVRRLMQYAGLDDLQVEIQPFQQEGDSTAAGLFMGIEDGKCRFGFNVHAPADAENMAGVMAHEVAHAYRAHHGLMKEDRQEEELLTDLTTCYLGFGILTTNNSYRYRASGEVVGGGVYQSWSTQQTGYLTPQGFGFLLGLQLAVRDTDGRTRRRVLRHLEPNQAAITRAAFEACQARSHDFPEVLGIPGAPPATPRSPKDVLQPLPEFDATKEITVEPRVSEPGTNAGRPVFRLRRRPLVPGAVVGLFLGMAVGMALAAVSSKPAFLAVFGAAGLLAGALWGGMTPHNVCAGAECGARLDPALDECPNCSGRIMGSIRRLADRFDAEDALRSGEPRQAPEE
jgi:hypothetical protein